MIGFKPFKEAGIIKSYNQYMITNRLKVGNLYLLIREDIVGYVTPEQAEINHKSNYSTYYREMKFGWMEKPLMYLGKVTYTKVPKPYGDKNFQLVYGKFLVGDKIVLLQTSTLANSEIWISEQ